MYGQNQKKRFGGSLFLMNLLNLKSFKEKNPLNEDEQAK